MMSQHGYPTSFLFSIGGVRFVSEWMLALHSFSLWWRSPHPSFFSTSTKVTMIIQPKPTRYKGITFRSRLEARWAMFLDNHSLISKWKYEPLTVTNSMGWTYTPDFQLTFYNRLYPPVIIEVKPNKPSRQYEESLLTFAGQIKQHLLIVYGNYYDIPFHVSTVPSDADLTNKINKVLWADKQALELAMTFRFDLKPTRRRR